MPKPKVKATGVWKSFLLSYILPIIGGLIVYFRNKKRDRELANICLVLSIFHSLIAGFLIGFGIGYLLFYLEIIESELIESCSIFLWIPASLLLTILLMKLFKDNKYKYFIPVWYLGFFGAIYSYYYAYRKNEPLRKDVGWFFFTQLLVFLIIGMMGGIISVWMTAFVEQFGSSEVIVNETINLEPGYYYKISFYSPPGVNVLEVNLESPAGIRFILLRPLECVRFENGESYYYDEQTDVTKLTSTYRLTQEGEWCVILWNLLPKNVSVRIESVIWYENPPETEPYYETANLTFPEAELNISPLTITKTIEVPILRPYENRTFSIRSGFYYPYSILLKTNQTVRFVINVSDGVINTVLVNSSEYKKLVEEGGVIYYFIEGYRSGIEETQITFTAPYDDKYYLVLANFPIFEGQSESLGDVEVRLEVYVS